MYCGEREAAMSKYTPPTWTYSNRNWRNEVDPHGRLYVSGGRYFSHDEDDEDNPCQCDCDGDREGCECSESCGWCEHGVCEVQGGHEGNARLIAAAPEMLRELEHLLKVLRLQPKPKLGDWNWPAMADRIEALIAKATKETPADAL